MVKIMEEVIDRHKRDEVLSASPLCHNQYTYIRGKAIVTALGAVIGDVESMVVNKEMMSCVFMDIDVFDNITYMLIRRADRKKGAFQMILSTGFYPL